MYSYFVNKLLTIYTLHDELLSYLSLPSSLPLLQLTVKLKSKRKFRRDSSVAKHVINLHSIGIIDNDNENDSNIQKVSDCKLNF